MYNVGGVTNINYDGNGGKAPASSQTVKKFKNWVNNDPLYAGYSFYGWVIDSFSIKTRKNSYLCNLNLKATWKLVNYSISYALNGSTLENKVETYNCLSRDFSLGQPKKRGYTFDGWSGTGLSEITKDVVVSQGSIGDRAYEAHFTAKSYNVTYDYGYDGVTSKATATYDSQFNVKSPSRDGYDFIGWTYNGEEFASKTWNIDSDITLTAHWKAKKYKISYDLNGGDNSPANLNEYTIETPTFTLSDPTKNGYDFVGWSGAGISGVSKDVAIEKGSIGNREYTANWKAHTYIVNLDSNGGECSTSKMNVDYNEKFVLPQPTKMGYTFAGWFNAEDNAEVTDCTWKFLFDLNLYAKWNINTYTITYVLGGGVNDASNPTVYNVESEDVILNNPSKKGYTFTGWNSKLGVKQFNPTISQGSIGDISFEATWEANLNTIVFFGNGNTDGETKSQQAYTDSKLKLNANGYVREGYVFSGWSETKNGLVKYVDQSEITVPTDSVYELYAVWSPNLNTITFNGNGSDSGTMDSQSMYTDSTENLTANGFSKTGYHFIGWSTKPTGDVEYIDKGSYKMGNGSSYDLYAKWEPNQYTISYNPNGGHIDVASSKVIYQSEYLLKVPSREGYFFAGWFMGDSQLSDSNGKSLSSYNIAGDIEVVAHWSPKTNVVILTNGSDELVNKGVTDSIIRLTKNPFTKDGYELLGWSEVEGGELKYYNDDLFYIGTRSSYRLYAIWEKKVETNFANYKKISTKEDLLQLLNKTSTSSKYYLNNDIDLEGATIVPNCYLFGDGEFDGNGHAIRNFKLSLSNYKITGDGFWWGSVYRYEYYTGLFKSNAATIKNLTLDHYEYKVDFGSIHKPSISSSTSTDDYEASYLYVGSLCSINQGVISNVTVVTPSDYFSLSIGGVYYIGNVCSKDVNNGDSITNCFVENNLSFSGDIDGVYNGHDCTDNGFYFGNIVGYKEHGTVSNSCIVNNGNVDVEAIKHDRLHNTNGTNNKNDFCGVGSQKTNNCKTLDKVSDYSPYICFNFGSEKNYQFVNGSERVTLRKNVFDKKGYEFIGWSTEENGEVQFSDEGVCYLPYGCKILNLYPVFEASTFIISFDSNGGEGNMDVQSGVCDTKLNIAHNTFFKTGYVFGGWSLVKDGNITYSDEDTITMFSNDVTFYAVWIPNENSIVFNGNGGKGSMDNQSIYTNTTVSLAACVFMAPEGYFFAGWSSSPDGEVEYNDCSNITSNGASIINLYAIWKHIH